MGREHTIELIQKETREWRQCYVQRSIGPGSTTCCCTLLLLLARTQEHDCKKPLPGPECCAYCSVLRALLAAQSQFTNTVGKATQQLISM
eukprot:14820-Heterococcus_DN1.PRE.4